MKAKREDAWVRLLGERLEATRLALGLKHIEMARVAEVSAQRWSNYVRGERPIDIEPASRLCDRYHLTLDWIYRGVIVGLPHGLAARLLPDQPTIIPLKKKR